MKHTPPPQRGTNEANLSTEQQATQADTRFSCTHEQPRRSPNIETPTRKGTQATDGQHPSQATPLTRPAAPDQRLPRTRRIRKRAEFLALQRVGRRYAGTRFVVITAPRQSGPGRIGITASRRVGGAVVRNRVKRLVREFFRRHQHAIVPPQDVLVIARTQAAEASYAEVVQELGKALRVHVEK
jgi:ribonuclease P protein component